MYARGTGHISTFAIGSRLVLVVSVLSSVCQCASASTPYRGTAEQWSLRGAVRQLGLPGNDNFAGVNGLAKTPRASANLLVQQLHTVRNPASTTVSDNDTYVNHVLWVIRALRYITGGMDFCAPTNHKFAKSGQGAYRNYWLHFANKNCVTYFAVWPSRGQFFIAPVDAQQKIIEAWRQWYAEDSKDFDYKPLLDPQSWQWLEGVKKVVVISPSRDRNR